MILYKIKNIEFFLKKKVLIIAYKNFILLYIISKSFI